MKLPFGLDFSTAQQMMRQMEEMGKQIKNISATGYAGGDMVTVTIDGNHNATVKISDEAYSIGGKEVLETLVAAAISDAETRLEEAMKEKNSETVAKMMGSLS